MTLSAAHEMPGGAQQPDSIAIPYGTRQTCAAGAPITEVFDRKGAERIAADLAGRIGKKGCKGFPVYHGHPDVPAVAAKYPMKSAVGWVTAVEPGEEAAVFRVRWLENPGEGFSHVSPYWAGTYDSSKNTLTVSQFLSLGLTNKPDYEEMSLPHEEPEDNHEKERRMDPKAIAKLLGLPDTATEEEIMGAVEAALKAKAEAEAGAAAEKAAAEQAAKELEHERKANRGAILDQAVKDGRITAAERGVWDGRIAHEANRATELAALAALPVKVKAAPVAKAVPAANPNRESIVALAHEKMRGDKSLDFNGAYLAVKAERPELWKTKE